jgi:hypothetical protein
VRSGRKIIAFVLAKDRRRLFLTGGGNIWYIEEVSASSRLGGSGLKKINLKASIDP